MAEAAGLDWKDGLTILGIGASLGWNWFNWQHSEKMEQRLRSEALRRDEWFRVRADIDGALNRLQSQKDQFYALSIGGHAIEAFRSNLLKTQEDSVQPYLNLASALRRADDSVYASGSDWEQLPEQEWDGFLEELNVIYENPDPSSARAQLKIASDRLDRIRRVVRERIDDETGMHDPTNLVKVHWYHVFKSKWISAVLSAIIVFLIFKTLIAS